MSDNDATRKRHRVADPLRRYIEKRDWTNRETDADLAELTACVYAIETDHERRMEQCRHETKRAFAKYLRQIMAEYERSHKRKSWLAQQRMQLEIDVLRYKEAKHEDD